MSLAQTTGQAIRFILDNDPQATKTRLAKALGVTYATVNNWENDKTKITENVYLILRKIYPSIEISDVFRSSEYTLGQVALRRQVLPTKQAISYVLAKDPQVTKTRLARALGCTTKTMSNYVSGRTRMGGDVYVAFRKLYPTVEITDVYQPIQERPLGELAL